MFTRSYCIPYCFLFLRRIGYLSNFWSTYATRIKVRKTASRQVSHVRDQHWLSGWKKQLINGKDALFLLAQCRNILYTLFHFENSINMPMLCLCYLWLNRNYYVVFERLFFLAGFVAHDPMVRKLPTRRFVDYPQKNRFQVTM